jgi:hypothetical protein
MIVSCGLLTTVLWVWAVMHPAVPVRWPLWPLLAWGVCGLCSCMGSRKAAGRRQHAVMALLLVLSVWLVQELHLLMPADAWRTAGQPVKAGVAGLQARAVERGQDLLSLQWIAGVSQPSWAGLGLGLPLCVIFLLSLGQHPAVPRHGQRAAQLGLALWALALPMYAGIGMNSLWPTAPWWFWLLLLALLPFQFKSARAELAMLVWCLALAAWLCKLLDGFLPLTLMRDGVVAVALVVTVYGGLVWVVHCEAMALFDHAKERHTAAAAADHAAAVNFDLQIHLDSPQAQEGADKYTRE